MNKLFFLSCLTLLSSILFSKALDDLIVKEVPEINGIIIGLVASGISEQNNKNTKIAEQVCLDGGREARVCVPNGYNKTPQTIAEAIDLISQIDRTFYWDRYKDQYGNYQWRCRGAQTGQFASNGECYDRDKNDNRWPD